MRTRTRSAQQTETLGASIGRMLQGGEVLALYGDLGAGKTAFVRGVGIGLGVASHEITSPTFVFVHEYAGTRRLIHVDLYRLNHPGEIDGLGLDDYVGDHTILALEWADRAGNRLPSDRLDIRLRAGGKRVRVITFEATGPRAKALVARLVESGAIAESASPK